jgi:hypothetical protein
VRPTGYCRKGLSTAQVDDPLDGVAVDQSTLLTDGSAPLSVKMANARSQTHRTEADTRGDEALKSRADLEQKLKAGGAQATWRHLWPHCAASSRRCIMIGARPAETNGR